MCTNSSVNARTIRTFNYVSWIVTKWDPTHQMNIPRLCEAHRGIRALQSAHMSRKLELSGIQWHVKYIWETHCCRVETQVRAKPSGSSLSGACFVATSSSRIEDSVRLRCKANVRFWLGFDNAYWLLCDFLPQPGRRQPACDYDSAWQMHYSQTKLRLIYQKR